MKMPWTKEIEEQKAWTNRQLVDVYGFAVGKMYVDDKIAKVDKKCLELAELLLVVSQALADLSSRVPEKSAPKKKGPKK